MSVAVRDHRARAGATVAIMSSGTDQRRLVPVQPRTMVEQAAEAIVAGAARGIFLPEDRLVEAEIARDLGISRVPVREALRLLESQGIVVSTPYKGMRLMQVSNKGVAALMRVRLALEDPGGARSDGPAGRAGTLRPPAPRGRGFADATRASDPALHRPGGAGIPRRALPVRGNPPLLALWQSLARQLAVVWGLALQLRDSAPQSEEHYTLVEALESGDEAGALALLVAHIEQHGELDFETLVAERRSQPAG